MSAHEGKRNRLERETSPYLLQHAHNPVDWYPWGEEALQRAREEDKPIFLSVGYSACHWCHVMERESFENPQIAELMNTLYVNIKVDREERPDIDEIYMKAVQALSGGAGGWPMSVFLTPALEPFFGATYMPPVRRYGRPSFPDVLIGLAEAWSERRGDVAEQAAELTRMIVEEARVDLGGEPPADVLRRSRDALLSSFDPTWGGFGAAPKFPHAGDIRLLLRHHLRDGDPEPRKAALFTLDRMAAGGIYDQLGGAFHRYSVDERWCIPHFEKMLYDNAQLVPAYLEGFLLTGDERYANVARESCDWVLREMITDGGGIASTQDADSEGEEGKYFVWTPAQLKALLGEHEGALVASYFDVTEAGNFEHGQSALWRPRSDAQVAESLGIELPALLDVVARARPVLLSARGQRIAPATDDKVLTAWNGLMISALAQAHQVLGPAQGPAPDGTAAQAHEAAPYLDAACAAARYVLGEMRNADGRLHATARAGRAQHAGCLDDYAFMIGGLLDLFESDFDAGWLRSAIELEAIVDAHFADRELGGYFTTADDHELLLARTKNVADGALPAGGAVMALSLARLARLTGQARYQTRCDAVIRSLGKLAERSPRALGQLLIALDFLQGSPKEVVLSGSLTDADTRALLKRLRGSFAPRRVVVLANDDVDTTLLPLCEGKGRKGGPALAYVCRDQSCQRPTDDPDALAQQLAER